MFKSIYLDVAIGMVFVFLLYSLLATAIQELISTWLSLRGKYLRKSIGVMLQDTHFKDKLSLDFYAHPLIRKFLVKRFDKLPSYIPPDVFSKVLKDILPNLYLGKDKELTDEERIELMPDGDLKRILLIYAKDNFADVDNKLQDWFNSSMERLSGAYKRNTQNRVLIIGLLIAACFNVDSIAVFQRLVKDDKARNAIAVQAEKFMEKNNDIDSLQKQFLTSNIDADISDSSMSGSDSIQKLKKDSLIYERFKKQKEFIKTFVETDIRDANNVIGIGWESIKGETIIDKIKKSINWNGLFILLGWFITALAITVGAPFWFDLLQKFIRIRGSGIKPLTENEKKVAVK